MHHNHTYIYPPGHVCTGVYMSVAEIYYLFYSGVCPDSWYVGVNGASYCYSAEAIIRYLFSVVVVWFWV